MRNFFRKITVVFVFSFTMSFYAQVVGLGAKFDKEVVFSANFNAPLFFDKSLPYDIAAGVEYTSANNKLPSGLQLQMSTMYFLDEGSSKSHLITAGVTAGYLFDFNKTFTNQFRLTPYVYAEIGFLYIKTGYDYYMPLQKGNAFISIGLGGGYLFRYFKLM